MAITIEQACTTTLSANHKKSTCVLRLVRIYDGDFSVKTNAIHFKILFILTVIWLCRPILNCSWQQPAMFLTTTVCVWDKQRTTTTHYINFVFSMHFEFPVAIRILICQPIEIDGWRKTDCSIGLWYQCPRHFYLNCYQNQWSGDYMRFTIRFILFN